MQVKNQNTTIGEFISALLTEREVDDVRIEEIIKSSETKNQTTAVRVASETPCILIIFYSLFILSVWVFFIFFPDLPTCFF